MRFYIGHRLPLGFYAGVGFGQYNARQIDHTTLLRGGSAPSGIGTAFKLAGFVSFMAFLIWCRMNYAP
jgi:hypothetical protein